MVRLTVSLGLLGLLTLTHASDDIVPATSNNNITPANKNYRMGPPPPGNYCPQDGGHSPGDKCIKPGNYACPAAPNHFQRGIVRQGLSHLSHPYYALRKHCNLRGMRFFLFFLFFRNAVTILAADY